MHTVAFQQARLEAGSLALAGEFFRGQVTPLSGGIFRVLIWQRPEDRAKPHWAAQELEPVAVHWHTGPNHAQAELAASFLRLELNPFRLLYQSGGLSLTLPALRAGLAPRAGAVTRMRTLATGEGDPYAETMDGYPIGWGLSLELAEDPQRFYYALGERMGYLNRKGRSWTNWNTDNHHHDPDTDPLYQSHPFLLAVESGQAAGLFLDETWRTHFDLAASEPNRSEITTEGPTLDLYLIPGPSPRAVVENYARLTGTPPLPPLWALGYHQCRWSYPDAQTVLAIAREFREREIPLEAIWLDIDYMDGYKVFTTSPHRFPSPAALSQELAADGVKVVTIIDPGVKKEDYPVYLRGKQIGAYVTTRREEELAGEVWPGEVVWPDFSRAEIRDWWASEHGPLLEAGIAGIWNDMNEPSAASFPGRTLPEGARHGAHWHAEIHNFYANFMNQATYQALQEFSPEKRPFILTRAGFAGVQRQAWVWTGDNSAYWSHLELAIPELINLGLSGVPFTGTDIGGFSGNADGELLARWTWAAALFPFMRNHAGKGSRKHEPWSFGEPYTSAIKKAIHFRYALLPYLYTLSQEASQTGHPLIRPLFWSYPEDPETYQIQDQFLLGEDLLAAPITRPGQSHRLAYLPGDWANFWSGARLSGYQPVLAALDSLPLFQRPGSAIPMTEPAAHTKSAYWQPLIWRIVPAPVIKGQVYQDAGEGYAPGELLSLEGGIEQNRLWLAGPAGSQAEIVSSGRKFRLTLGEGTTYLDLG